MKRVINVALVAATLSMGADRALAQAGGAMRQAAELQRSNRPRSGSPLMELAAQHKRATAMFHVEQSQIEAAVEGLGLPPGMTPAEFDTILCVRKGVAIREVQEAAKASGRRWAMDLPRNLRPMQRLASRNL